jgi:hypothetical protein
MTENTRSHPSFSTLTRSTVTFCQISSIAGFLWNPGKCPFKKSDRWKESIGLGENGSHPKTMQVEGKTIRSIVDFERKVKPPISANPKEIHLGTSGSIRS